MKKALLIFLIFFTAEAYSQTLSYGVTAGFTYTNMSGTGTFYFPPSNDYIPGYQVGGLLDIGFKSFSIQPGVLYITAGGHAKDYFPDAQGQLTAYRSNRIVLHYARIPVNFLYKLKTGTNIIFIGRGPYLAIGLWGKYDYGPNNNYGYTLNLRFGSGAAGIENLEFGLNGIVGLRLKSGLAVTAGYSSGLTNVYSDTNYSNRNRGFNLSEDYFF
jgi:hypothetical protein